MIIRRENPAGFPGRDMICAIGQKLELETALGVGGGFPVEAARQRNLRIGQRRPGGVLDYAGNQVRGSRRVGNGDLLQIRPEFVWVIEGDAVGACLKRNEDGLAAMFVLAVV